MALTIAERLQERLESAGDTDSCVRSSIRIKHADT